MNIKVEVIGYMMDRKAENAYLGLQGSYCDLLDFSKQQCHLLGPKMVIDIFGYQKYSIMAITWVSLLNMQPEFTYYQYTFVDSRCEIVN